MAACSAGRRASFAARMGDVVASSSKSGLTSSASFDSFMLLLCKGRQVRDAALGSDSPTAGQQLTITQAAAVMQGVQGNASGEERVVGVLPHLGLLRGPRVAAPAVLCTGWWCLPVVVLVVVGVSCCWCGGCGRTSGLRRRRGGHRLRRGCRFRRHRSGAVRSRCWRGCSSLPGRSRPRWWCC